MSITVNIYYSGKNGSARRFAEEMMESGTVSAIRQEPGNLQYAYFYPMEDRKTVLLIDSWENQEAIDAHHHIEKSRKTGRKVIEKLVSKPYNEFDEFFGSSAILFRKMEALIMIS